MQVVKKVNNNTAVCVDGYGHELIAFGRGIGFPAVPYELTDLSKVQRTFYDVNPQYLKMIELLPGDVVELTSTIVDSARGILPYRLSPNILLTLADHISFAIERKKKGIFVRMPLTYDLEQMYPEEMKLARKALRSIWLQFKVRLPDDEASGIAMAFINARVYSDKEKGNDNDKGLDSRQILNEITHIIEKNMNQRIDVTSFNYTRYATHIQYLLERLQKGKGIDSINLGVFESIRQEYEDTAACADQVVHYLKNKHGFEVTDEEHLYLMLHINRVCTSEGL